MTKGTQETKGRGVTKETKRRSARETKLKMSDSEDDVPLIVRKQMLAAKTPPPPPASNAPAANAEMMCTPCPLPGHMLPVDGEGLTLTGQAWVDRAYRFRKRATRIFEAECDAVYANPRVNAEQKDMLRKFKFILDRGTTRRGVCNYQRSYIGLSAKMVDNGASADAIAKIVRHEISHACTPKQHHNATWQAFDLLIGGDGKRCCTSAEVKEVIGHRVEVYCEKGGPRDGTGHYFAKKQKAPTTHKLRTKCCGKCKKEGHISKLLYRRI